MARPRTTLTEEQVREVESLAALLNQDQIADDLGIARNTFCAICARDEEVSERYERGKAKAIAHVANGHLQKAWARGTTSAIFYLKTQAGWREKSEVEHSGVVAGTGGRDRLQLLLDHIADCGNRIGVGPDDRAAIGGTAVPEPPR